MVPEAVDVGVKEAAPGYQGLRVVQDVVLALLAKEASHGYELRTRRELALGPLGEALNAGHVYVTLGRLEKAGLVGSQRGGSAGSARPQGVRADCGRACAGRGVAGRHQLAEARTGGVPSQAGRRRVGRARGPVRARRCPAPRVVGRVGRRAAGGAGRSRPLRSPGCCSRASCCGCRRTCAGSRRAKDWTSDEGGTLSDHRGAHPRLGTSYGHGDALVRAVDASTWTCAAARRSRSAGRAAAGSRRCCTCWAGWTGPRAGRCGSPDAGR